MYLLGIIWSLIICMVRIYFDLVNEEDVLYNSYDQLVLLHHGHRLDLGDYHI